MVRHGEADKELRACFPSPSVIESVVCCGKLHGFVACSKFNLTFMFCLQTAVSAGNPLIAGATVLFLSLLGSGLCTQ